MSGTENQEEWWATGYDEAESLPDYEPGDRFYLKNGKGAMIIFLDGSPDDATHFNRRYGAPFCFPAGAGVMTGRGYLPIEQVLVGDQVLRADGTVGQVTKVLSRKYTGTMVSAGTKKRGDPLVATAGHKVRVLASEKMSYPVSGGPNRKQNRDKAGTKPSKFAFTKFDVVEMPIDQLSEGDFLVCPGVLGAVPLEQATIVGPHDKPMPLTEDLAWLLGAYAAEGHNHGGPTWSLDQDEADFAEAITETCVEIFREVLAGQCTLSVGKNHLPESRTVQWVVYGRKLGEWFEQVCGKYSVNKRLPGEVVFGHPALQKAALTSLLQGDGCQTSLDDGTNRITLNVVSPHLARQAMLIAQTHGRKPGIRTVPERIDADGVKHQKSYTVTWSFSEQTWWAGHYFEQGVGKIKTAAYALPVTEIEHYDVENQQVYNLTIEDDGKSDDPHSYTVNGFGVSNCVFEAAVPLKDGEGGTNWRNWLTAVRGRKDKDGQPIKDPIQDLMPDIRPYYVGAYTVVVVPEDVDLAKLIKARKPLRGGFKKILAAKKKDLARFKRHSSKRGGLRGCVFEMYRSDAQGSSNGNDQQFEVKLTDEQLKILFPDGEDLPVVYHDALAPKSREEIAEMVPHRAKVSKFDKSGKSGKSGSKRRGDDDDQDGTDDGADADGDETRSERRPSRRRSSDESDESPAETSKSSSGEKRGAFDEDLPF